MMLLPKSQYRISDLDKVGGGTHESVGRTHESGDGRRGRE